MGQLADLSTARLVASASTGRRIHEACPQSSLRPKSLISCDANPIPVQWNDLDSGRTQTRSDGHRYT